MELQNINLLHSLPARQPVYFSFRVYKIGMLGLISFLLVIYLLFFTAGFFKSKKVAMLLKQRTLVTDEITKVAGGQQDESVDKTLQDNIMVLKNKIAASEKVLRLLNNQEQIKFSVFFESLANNTPDDLWIKIIHIIPSQEYVNLEGNTTNPSLVSLFLHQLSNSKEFEKYKFSVVDIKETKDDYFSFSVKTKSDTPEQREKKDESDTKKS